MLPCWQQHRLRRALVASQTAAGSIWLCGVCHISGTPDMGSAGQVRGCVSNRSGSTSQVKASEVLVAAYRNVS